MMQLSNTELVNAIASLKDKTDIELFVAKRKKAIQKFIQTKKFSYKIKVGKKKKSRVYFLKNSKEFRDYLVLLESDFEKIVFSDSTDLLIWKQKFDNINLKGHQKNEVQGFFNRIITLLKYSELRSGKNNFIFNFYKELNLKVCVYCNSQHIILLKQSKIARLQADHNLPKSIYPCFSISFANLYPSCNNCNHIKDDKDLNYSLYYDTTPNSDLKFKLHSKDIANYLLDKVKEESLKVEFEEGISKLNEVLAIDEIYENHTDYATDLIRKHILYSSAYLDSLSESFKKLYGDKPDLLSRLVFGTTLEEKDINQRVFSKLTLDLKTQLDLLAEEKK